MEFINSKTIENEKNDENFNRSEFQASFLETIQVFYPIKLLLIFIG